MNKKRSFFYIIGCSIIGIAALLLIYFALAGTGVIHVKQNKLVFAASSAEKIYDGEPLEADGWTLEQGTLQKGHRVQVVVGGTQVIPGEGTNAISVEILDDSDMDVTSEYEVECVPGVLRVLPIPLSVQSQDASKVYDGTPLTNPEYFLASGSLMDGHELSAVTQGSITEIGTAENYFSTAITDMKTGQDVSYLYGVEYINGTLEIKPIPLLIVTYPDEKEYDGEALICERYSLQGNPMAGHVVKVEITGKLIHIGEADNTAIVSVKRESDGYDVSELYDITVQCGTLTVSDPDAKPDVETPEIPEMSVSSEGMANLNQIPDSSEFDMNTPILNVNSSVDATLLLRIASYGEYHNGSFGSATAYDATGAVTNPLYLASNAIAGSDAKKANLRVEVLSGGSYSLPYYIADGKEGYDNDICIMEDASFYTAYYYLYDYISGKEYTLTDPELIALEKEYREFVYDTYLQLPSDTRSALLAIAQQEPSIQSAKYNRKALIGAICHYVQNAGRYDFDAANYPAGVDTAVYFLTEAKAGVCVQFATAATCLYRAMGIPARMTVGVSAQNLVAGEWTTLVTGDQHAWVEVYVDGMGWVAVDPTGGSGIGDGDAAGSTPLTITALSGSKPYDGTPLTAAEVGYRVSGLLEGHRMEQVSMQGEILYVGTAVSQVVSWKIVDENDNDVTYLYQVTTKDGELEITEPEKIHLVIVAEDQTAKYNGEAHFPSEHAWHYEGQLDEGDTVIVKTMEREGDGILAGIYTIRVKSYQIVNAKGEDVTESKYAVVLKPGELTVLPKKITITTESATKPYDGNPLTAHAVTGATQAELAEGDTLVMQYSGTQTQMGSSPNYAKVTKIVNAKGVNVTSCYEIEDLVTGILTVTEPEYIEITVKPRDEIEEYTGTRLTAKEVEIVRGSLRTGDSIEAVFEGSIIDPGEEISRITEIRILCGDVDVTYLYDIVMEPGKLVVKNPQKIEINLFTKGETKEYDGVPLVGKELGWYYTGALMEGHRLEVVLPDILNHVGSIPNRVESYHVINWTTGEDVTDLYQVIIESGRMEIVKRELTVIANSDSKIYDGEALTNGGYTVEGLPNGFRMDGVRVEGSQTDVGIGSNWVYGGEVLNQYGIPVTENFIIQYNEGALKVTPRPITLVTGSDSKVYDGKELTCHVYDPILGVLPNHTVTVLFGGSQTDAGSSPNTASLMIFEDGRDVTNNYEVTAKFGTLTVTVRTLHIQTDSAFKYYDGMPLTCHVYTSSGLLDGHTIRMQFTGSITECGTAPNTATVTDVVDGSGKSVMKNYKIIVQTGTLEVREGQREITLTVKTTSRTYQGKSMYPYEAGYKISAELDPNHYLDVDALKYIGKTLKGIGTATVTIDPSSIVIRDLYTGENVTDRYAFTVKSGSISQTKIRVTVTSRTAEKLYDGTPLTEHGTPTAAFGDGASILPGHRLVYTFSGSQTQIGSSANYFTVDVVNESGASVLSYYDITLKNGKLSVYQNYLTFYTKSATKDYDGKALQAPNVCTLTDPSALSEGHYVASANCYATVTEPGSVLNVPTVVIRDAAGNDVTYMYKLTSASYGTLTVNPLSITVVAQSQTIYTSDPNAMLSCGEYTVIGELIDGHELISSTYGEQYGYGSAENIINVSETRVIDRKNGGRDVTKFYTIGYQKGLLCIYPE